MGLMFSTMLLIVVPPLNCAAGACGVPLRRSKVADMITWNGSVYPPDSFVVVSHVLLIALISVLGLSACSSTNGALIFVAVSEAAACQPFEIRRVPAISNDVYFWTPSAGTIVVPANARPFKLAGYSQYVMDVPGSSAVQGTPSMPG